MTNSCLKFGIKILDRIMIPRTVKQGHYLKTPQCAFCQKYHHPGHCGGVQPTCPHCGGEHRRFECDKKNIPPFCTNCGGHHKATSNLCPTRRKLLTDNLIPDAIMDDLISPFGPTKEKITFVEAPLPTPNAWNTTNQVDAQQREAPLNMTPHASPPITLYYDCMWMALLFSNWYPAFLILQTIFGLTRIELPEALREGSVIKPENSIKLQNPPPGHTDKSHSQIPTTARENSSPGNNPNSSRGSSASAHMRERPNNAAVSPLTGANSIPLTQRSGENKSDRRNNFKPALLPIPEDPFRHDGGRNLSVTPGPLMTDHSLPLNLSPVGDAPTSVYQLTNWTGGGAVPKLPKAASNNSKQLITTKAPPKKTERQNHQPFLPQRWIMVIC